ncbi:MAG: adenine phosphoribosyltransferase [Planctomycetota bacterium]
MDLNQFIRDIPDFPKPGIVFKDITPLLASPQALRYSITCLANAVSGHRIDVVAGIESRGFIFGVPVARELGVGFVPIRKPGKLPWKTSRVEYVLEYGTDSIEIHQDAVRSGDRVLIVDDLLATGGTMAASIELIESSGGMVVACAVVIELAFLGGRKKAGDKDLYSLISYD